MARIIERTFSAAKPVFARKNFIANGRRFAPGDLLPWRKMAVAERRIRQMFEGGLLTHEMTSSVDFEEAFALKPEPKAEVIVEEPEANDDLDQIDSMKELRKIADDIGAPYKLSKAEQRQAIRDHRTKE
jgi:hypothetical protein